MDNVIGKNKKLFAILGALALLVIFAVGPMALTSSGVDNYTGVKRDAALNVLDADRSAFGPTIPAGLSRAHVDNVEPSPQGKDRQGNPLRCTDNPNEIHYYSVTVRRVWLFGTTWAKSTYKVCNTAG